MKIDGPGGGLYDDWLRSIKTGEAAATTGRTVEDFTKEIKGQGDVKAEDVEAIVSRIEAQEAGESDGGGKSDLEVQFADFLNRLLLALQEDSEATAENGDSTDSVGGTNPATEKAGAASGGTDDPKDESKRKTVVIDGVEVIVSGHTADDMAGSSLFRPVDPEQSLRLNDKYINLESDPENYVQAVMKVVSSTPYEPLPAGSTSYMSVRHGALAGEIRPREILTDPEADAAQDRAIVNDFFHMVDVERKLKEEYGEDVKLTYSHRDQGYIMLTPTDAHYDTLASTEENTSILLESLGLDQNMLGNVKDILKERGLFA